MTHRHFAWIGWLILAICIASVVVSLILFQRSGTPILLPAMLLLAFMAFPTLGALVISQRQTNTVGWLFCLAGLGTAITSFSAAYIQLALRLHTDAQLLTGVVDLIGGLVWPMNIVIGLLLLYLFPDGRALSPRWRLIVWALLLSLLCMTVAQTVVPGPLETNGRVPNPLGIPELADMSSATIFVGHLLLPVFALLAILSLGVRYRRAAPTERQQIKWFVFGAALMIVIATGGGIAAGMISNTPNDLIATAVGNGTFALGILALPTGVGIGVLRFRLYDIDILINRTLVYGSLTAILASLYFGLVLGAQVLTRLITGQQTQSPLVIVLSTLLIATLVQPLRARLQRAIDRRFYHSRYNATRTLAAFSATLRQEVRLASLREHLLGVVEETMRPSHTFLWLSQPKAPGAPTRSED